MNHRLKKEFFNAILRKSFKAFVMKVFNEVAPNATYLDSWYIDLICEAMMDIYEGKQTRLIVNVPPRYMKSIICSIAFPAFILGHNPKAGVICVSYNDTLAEKLALDCRKIMESEWYKELFPGTRISKNKKSIADFETTAGGGRFSTSVGGTLTGRGGDYLLIDDPVKPTDALSETVRTKVNEWFGNTLYSRLNNKHTGKIVVIMQRLHDDDLTGYLLSSDESYRHICLPAIAECDEEWRIGNKIVVRKKGEALHPERESLDMLRQAREQMGEYTFAGQYQQNPAPLDGGIIKASWLKCYNKEELFKSIAEGTIKLKSLVFSWDTACKVAEHNDYSVCIVALVDTAHRYYIIDVYRERLEFPSLITQVLKLYEKYKNMFKATIRILIEEHSSGISLIQSLKKEKVYRIIGVKPEHDKATRLMAVSHFIENGSCLFPDDNPDWWETLRHELLRFPNGKYDDQCDALSQLLGNPPKITAFDTV